MDPPENWQAESTMLVLHEFEICLELALFNEEKLPILRYFPPKRPCIRSKPTQISIFQSWVSLAY